MSKSIHHFRYLLFAFLLLLAWPANSPAQGSGTVSPPIPEAQPPDPPDAYTLPVPPQLEWTSLAPKEQESLGGGLPPEDVPPPKEDVVIAPPPAPVIENSVPGGVDPAEIEIVKPEVEIWRSESEWPQVPERRSTRLDRAYVTGTEPVWLRVQFDERAAGMTVYVRRGRGITLNPPGVAAIVESNGECLVLAQLADGVDQSHVSFSCSGMQTVLPVVRSSLTTVIAAEEETGGRH
jgi:hypothetical protein